MNDTQNTNQQSLLQQINPSGSNLSDLAKESVLQLEEEKDVIERVKETVKLMTTPMPPLPETTQLSVSDPVVLPTVEPVVQSTEVVPQPLPPVADIPVTPVAPAQPTTQTS